MSPRRKTHRFRPCSDVTLTSQRPLFDQPNLYWRRPPSITDLLRPTVDLLQPPTTYTMTSLRPNKANLTLSSVYDRPGTTYCQPTTTSNDLHSDLSTTKKPILASSFDLDRPAMTYCQPTTTSNDLHSDLFSTNQTYTGVVPRL